MTRLISSLAGLGSFFALRSRETAPRGSRVDAARLQATSQSRKGAASPTWPPPDGVYWGM